MKQDGYRQVAVQIPNTLYLKLKDSGIVMSEVMRDALEKAVNEYDSKNGV